MATKIVGTCALCLADNVELTQEHIIPFETLADFPLVRLYTTTEGSGSPPFYVL